MAALVVAHAPLLRLPYFWDEAGYYIPAARDLLLHGALIPQSTPSNAHPPLVMAYLALWWKVFHFSPVVTRLAMLMVAAFTLAGLFRLARLLAGSEVAIAATVCTALYPVFFVQSSLGQVDLAAAGLLFWGLSAYFERRDGGALLWFSMAVLAKETAVLIPAALCGYELLMFVRPRLSGRAEGRTILHAILPGLAAVPLFFWYAYHYQHTGVVFGNPEYLRYNLQATVHPLRIMLALLLRSWQVLGYLNLFVLTLSVLVAMFWGGKKHIVMHGLLGNGYVRGALAMIIVVYLAAMSVLGGAVLARYMLPITPLVMVISFAVLESRVRGWQWLVPVVAISFLIALFTNPPYGISLEDNLAYRDYILLHQQGEAYLQAHYPRGRVLTAWPATDELRQPYLGYVGQPSRVVAIEDFTVEQLEPAAALDTYDTALVFSTKLIPRLEMFGKLTWWQEWKTRYFGFHTDLPPAAAADVLGGKVVFSASRGGQWIAVIERPRALEAKRISSSSSGRSGFLE